MNVYFFWVISAIILILTAFWIGHRASNGNILGIFLDTRGRFSLSQFQIVLWTIVVLSLISGVFLARLFGGVNNPLNINIPSELLIVMGISVGSAVTAGAVKASKDLKSDTNILDMDNPKFSQVYLVEEGKERKKDLRTVDATKFQNFWLTLIIVMAYIASVVTHISNIEGVDKLDSLPGFSSSLLTLLGISHAGYIAGKLPDKK